MSAFFFVSWLLRLHARFWKCYLGVCGSNYSQVRESLCYIDLYKKYLVHPLMLRVKGCRRMYISGFDFNEGQQFQSSKGGIKRIGFVSFLYPELKSSRSVEKTSANHDVNTKWANDGSKKRGPTSAFSRSIVLLAFPSAVDCCVVSTFIEILVGCWMKIVTSGFSVNTPRDGNYIMSRTYPSSSRRSRREVAKGEGYARAVTCRPQG